MYQARAISKSIGSRKLVHDVSVACASGNAIAIVGPNGAGKTVLLKALAMADPPSTGEIDVDGLRYVFPPPSGQILEQAWPCLTFVFQQLFLWPHLTLRDNILMPAELKSGDNGSTQKRADHLTQFLGIDSLLSRFPNQVSGGQRQRAAIARALLLQPKWLLLDEPTSAQDVEQVVTLTELLREAKTNGVGIIFSTHLLGFAASIADEILFLDQGAVVEQGSIDLLSQPNTDRMRKFISIVEHGTAARRSGNPSQTPAPSAP
jgi:ABC-type polar amino acid transport system ATPase subunit